ncbi:NAD(P)H-dependent oxidoreductase [Rothia nasimurium]|uniref:NAD(P)H-dependent oxidoreductase n=1 Tax=Rothia nasimurium TaxID=85336 RepID=A0A1Y1RMA9_9MICC|nr:NAD(P)H-dependent oxidoreductase [Rothia nasimurium]ORC15593.1 NAD(P)H-dependent oxidoreductase [Rothia nasimurium]
MQNQAIKQLVLDAAQRRRAIKFFDPEKKISDADINYILETARLSPSSVGAQGWRFVVLQNPELREALKSISWGAARQLGGASHFVLILAKRNMHHDGPHLQASLTSRNLSPEDHAKALETYKSFQVNDMGLTTDRALFDWSAKQTYIALGNMMTAAALIGIDSCPIEGFNVEKANALLADQGIIDPETEGIVTMLALGYRAEELSWPQTRKPAEEVITWVE